MVSLSSLWVHFFSVLILFWLGRPVAEVIQDMLTATRLTVIIKAGKACHLDAEVVFTRDRLHADDTTL